MMYLFTKDSTNGMKFFGYQAKGTVNRTILVEAQNIVSGTPFPDMLKVPSGNAHIVFLMYSFLNVAHQCRDGTTGGWGL